MHFQHIVKNGTLVTPEASFQGNIYIRDEKIFALTQGELPGTADEITDATGLYVLPGFIETHAHSRDGRLGPTYKEGFDYATRAAAAGGVTTILEMPNCNPAIYCVENLLDLLEVITPKAHIDFGVWGMCLGDLNKDQIRPLADAGVIAFKFWGGYAIDPKSYQLIYNYSPGMGEVIAPLDAGEIYKIFRDVTRTGRVMGIHAESFEIIQAATAEVMAGADRSYQAMLRARPAASELVTTDMALELAEALGTRLHIVHVAVGDAVDRIRRAKDRGVHVTAETCTHYLTLTDQDYDRVGALMKVYPLIRTRRDRDLLWQGVRDGTLDFVCSDHAPHAAGEKKDDLWTSPAGMASVEVLAPVMLSAVNRGEITINQVAALLSEHAAKIFDLYPRKGSLAVGADADLAIVDLRPRYLLDQTTFHSRHPLSPLNGLPMQGKNVQTILRGRTVAKNGEIIGAPAGRFVKPE